MRIVWGKVRPGQWEQYEQAYKTVLRPGHTCDTVIPEAVGDGNWTNPWRMLNGRPVVSDYVAWLQLGEGNLDDHDAITGDLKQLVAMQMEEPSAAQKALAKRIAAITL